MYCNICGTQVPTGTMFCPKCGQKMSTPSTPQTMPHAYNQENRNVPNSTGYSSGPIPPNQPFNNNTAYGYQVNRVTSRSIKPMSTNIVGQVKLLIPVFLAGFAVAMSRLSWCNISIIGDLSYSFDLLTTALYQTALQSYIKIPSYFTILGWCLLITVVATFISTFIIFTTKGTNYIPFLVSLSVLAVISLIVIIYVLITDNLSPTPFVFLCLISSVSAFVLLIIDHSYKTSKYFM